MTDAELGYLAGVFDGEGSIAIVKMRRPPYKEVSYNLIISVTNSDPDLIDFVRQKLGGNVTINGRYKGRGKLVKRWYQAGTKAAPILRTLFPYLIAKRQQALLALEYLDMGRGWHRAARAYMHERMHALNHAGKEAQVS